MTVVVTGVVTVGVKGGGEGWRSRVVVVVMGDGDGKMKVVEGQLGHIAPYMAEEGGRRREEKRGEGEEEREKRKECVSGALPVCWVGRGGRSAVGVDPPDGGEQS